MDNRTYKDKKNQKTILINQIANCEYKAYHLSLQFTFNNEFVYL